MLKQNQTLVLVLLIVVSLVFSCNSGSDSKPITTMPTTCIYADGSGNSYVFRNSPNVSFEYRSITPKESSSGIYYGGDPIFKDIEVDDFEEVKSMMERLLQDESIRVTTRMKGTGFIKIQTETDEVFEYVDPQKDAMKDLIALVQDFRD